MNRRARRLAAACEPLIGTHWGEMHQSAQHKGVVSLWLQSHLDGRIQVCAVVPMQDYRLLFKEFFTDPTEARAYWCEQYAELFGHQPELTK